MAYRSATANYYRDEERLFKEAYNFGLRDDDVDLILNKLCRHFNIPKPRIRFYGHAQSGCASGNCIRLSHKPSIGLLIHELGHLARDKGFFKELFRNISNKGTEHHGTHFQTTLTHLHTWARSKRYWRGQLIKRLQKAAVVKTESKETQEIQQEETILQSKIDDTLAKIRKKEQAMGRYHKKLQYYERLYGTKMKKGRMSMAALRRALKKYEQQAVLTT